jgi:hypothetical protein
MHDIEPPGIDPTIICHARVVPGLAYKPVTGSPDPVNSGAFFINHSRFTGSMKERIDSDDLCTLLGGDFDFETDQCTFKIPAEHDKASIIDQTTFVFFVMQIVIGCATTVFAVYYNPISIPVEWWVQYIAMAISTFIAFLMYWIKTKQIRESVLRTAVSLVTIMLFSTAFGCLLRWDLLAYITLEAFSAEPATATISGIIVAALLSYVITPPEERFEGSKGKGSAGTFPLYG